MTESEVRQLLQDISEDMELARGETRRGISDEEVAKAHAHLSRGQARLASLIQTIEEGEVVDELEAMVEDGRTTNGHTVPPAGDDEIPPMSEPQPVPANPPAGEPPAPVEPTPTV